VKKVMICLPVLTECTNMTDRHRLTQRQTDTAWWQRPRLLQASRGKNCTALRALIFVAWFSSLSFECLRVFGLHGAIYIYVFFFKFVLTSFSLPLVSWAWCIGPWRGWLTKVTVILKCCDTAGWVIWPVTSSWQWHCWLGYLTRNVILTVTLLVGLSDP